MRVILQRIFFSILIIIYFAWDKILIYYIEFAYWLYPLEANRNAELLKIILTSFGGIGLLIGLYLSYKRALATDKGIILQGEAINKQSEQLELSRKSQIDERFKNAVEHLGSDKEPIILGGIAELHQIAIENSKDYAEVIFNILTSYIRSAASINKKGINRTIVQTIINYLFKSNSDYTLYYNSHGNLNSCNFYMLDLTGVNFSSFNLRYSVFPQRIEGVDFSKSDLRGAVFQSPKMKLCNFSEATIYETLFYLGEFEKVNMRKAQVFNSDFINCKFIDVDFKNSSFYKNKLLMTYNQNNSYVDASFIDNSFLFSKFIDIDYSTADIVSGNDFRGSEFKNVKLYSYTAQSNFRGCTKNFDLSKYVGITNISAKMNIDDNYKVSTEILNFELINFTNSYFGDLTEQDHIEITTEIEKMNELIRKKEEQFMDSPSSAKSPAS